MRTKDDIVLNLDSKRKSAKKAGYRYARSWEYQEFLNTWTNLVDMLKTSGEWDINRKK